MLRLLLRLDEVPPAFHIKIVLKLTKTSLVITFRFQNNKKLILVKNRHMYHPYCSMCFLILVYISLM